MIRRGVCLSLLVVFSLCSTTLFAQAQTASERLALARAEYYTPTVNGLSSFRCEATVDWKALFARINPSGIATDDPVLKYLQGVHLALVDQLNGNGSIEWMATEAPPAGKEQSIRQMHDGFQTMVGGFFQSWNAYMNGGMVPLPDNGTVVTLQGDGIHLHAAAAGTQLDEDFDKDGVLTQAVVETPAAKIVAMPTFVRTDGGLVVSAVTSRINQPPTAPQVEVTFQVEYAIVGSFRLPSHLVYDLKNIARIEIGLKDCQASATDSTR